MQNSNEELESFKTNINLTAYAASLGYALDRKASSRNCAVMKRDGHDKIVISKGLDLHWVFFAVHDPADNGSIIDFVAKRMNISLGRVRQELRAFAANGSNFPLEASLFLDDLEPISRDLSFVRAKWEEMEPLPFGQHEYLNQQRKLPASLLSLPFLQDRIRCDKRGNAAFPHFASSGLTGFELKNNCFTGFAKHGVKGLWGTRPKPDDTRLVIAETAIDALAYALLHGAEKLRLVSTAGELNKNQPGLVISAIRKLPRGQVISAVDNDDGGDALHQKIATAFKEAARSDLELVEDRPAILGQDWGDVLCYSQT